MTRQSQTVLSDFQVRKSCGQKRAFRAWLRGQLEGAGWTVTEESGRFSGTNVIAGDPEKAEVLFTAHYDTQAVLPFPNFITPRNMGVYLLYQLLIVVIMFFTVAVVSFVSALIGYMTELPTLAVMLPGWLVCAFCIWWVFFGKANRHTANDNTSGVVTLLEAAFPWEPGQEYRLDFTAQGGRLTLAIDGRELLAYEDPEPLRTGCAGLSVEDGSHCLYRDLAITGGGDA